MDEPDDEKALLAMATRARRLAVSVSDQISINALFHYAEDCEQQASRLKAARLGG